MKKPFALLLVLTVSAKADDASLRKQIVGYWSSGRHVYEYRADGTSWMCPVDAASTHGYWAVADGQFFEAMEGGRLESEGTVKIVVSLPRFDGHRLKSIKAEKEIRRDVRKEIAEGLYGGFQASGRRTDAPRRSINCADWAGAWGKRSELTFLAQTLRPG